MFLQVNHIVFSYNEKHKVLNDISFALPKGETIAIVGSSGCGKSTLLRLISGILNIENKDLSNGEINIDGLSANEYRKAGKLAFMFQESTLMPNLTVRQNIEFPLRIKGINNPSKVDELLETVGLSQFEHYLPKHLSGGMKTRVALARSFVTEPELLLLDEPFSALDIGWKRNLYDKLQTMRKKLNTTIVFVTHDIQEAICLSNTFIVIGRNGSVLDEYSLKNTAVKEDNYIEITQVPTKYAQDLGNLQTLIAIDSERMNATWHEVESILQLLKHYAGDDNFLTIFKKAIIPIRKFSSEPEVSDALINIYSKSTNEQKFELVWDILQSPQSEKLQYLMFNFLFEHIDDFNTKCASFYNADKNQIYSISVGRINTVNERSPKSKKWLYLLNLLYSNDYEKVKNYLEEVAEERNSNFEYPFAAEVAKKLLLKVDEKKAHISVA